MGPLNRGAFGGNSVELLERVQEHLDAEQYMVFASAESMKEGNALITACPGSGKTRGVASRLALKVDAGEAIAVTSFTNVAASEIMSQAVGLGVAAGGNNFFCGTLHQLLLRYILRPWGHMVMGCPQVPRIRRGRSGDTVSVDEFAFEVDDFRVRATGDFSFSGERPSGCYLRNDDIARRAKDAVIRLKRKQARSGYVTADDAMFWALQVVRRFPAAGESLAARFSEMIIDEAQDCSDVQLEILREVSLKCGLRSLVMVGDFDQSIYSFQGASPGLGRALSREVGLKECRLRRNYRSSQKICGIAGVLRRQPPDVAAGVHSQSEAAPSVVLYPERDLPDLVEKFSLKLSRFGIPPESGAILGRTGGLLSKLVGRKAISGKRFGVAAALIEAVSAPEPWSDISSLRAVESVLSEWSEGLGEASSAIVAEDLRASALEWIVVCADKSLTLGDWRAIAEHEGAAAVSRLVGAHHESCGIEIQIPPRLVGVRLQDFSATRPAGRPRVSTVHGVKGESLAGVLLVGDPQGSHRGFDHDLWANFYDGDRSPLAEPNDEARVLYVAVTRAQVVCDIAVPQGISEDALRKFLRAGFGCVSLADY